MMNIHFFQYLRDIQVRFGVNMDVIIIGGGASGMFAAGLLRAGGLNVLVLDRMEKTCKKIYATGNGKCNFTNESVTENDYNTNAAFAMNIISKFDNNMTIDYFRKIGIVGYNNNGYIYPYSRQAMAVAGILTDYALSGENVSVKTECNVKAVDKTESGYVVTYDKKEGKEYKRYKKETLYVIMATGGQSDRKLGSDGSGYYFLKRLGVKIEEPIEALVPLVTYDNLSTIKGVRIIARVKALDDEGIDIASDEGEIIFNENGVSGIPIFQISSKVSSSLRDGKNIDLNIDMAPYISKKDIKDILNIKNKTTDSLIAILPDKLAAYVRRISANDEELINNIKSLKLSVSKTAGFDKSQVTKGGINVNELNPDTLELKKYKGLYAVGELIDVDGKCGGYNLQWAWSSAYAVCKSILENMEK